MDDVLEDLLQWAQLRTLAKEQIELLDWALEARPVEGLVGMLVIEAALRSGVVASKGEARRSLVQGGLFLNFRKVTDAGQRITDADLIADRVLIRRGSRDFGMVRAI